MSTSKPAAGKLLAKVKQQLDESLSSILILNTLAHTMGAAGFVSQAVQIFGVEWETLIAVLLTLAILYFSEIIPQNIRCYVLAKMGCSVCFHHYLVSEVSLSFSLGFTGA
jgi:Mg2+/Co2+ transporter CorB